MVKCCCDGSAGNLLNLWKQTLQQKWRVHAHLSKEKNHRVTFNGRVPAEPGVQLQGLPGHSTPPVAGSTLPTLHCNLADLPAGTPLLSQPPEEPLDLR